MRGASWFTKKVIGVTSHWVVMARVITIAGLTAVAAAYNRFRDQQNNPLGARAAILVVPPELEITALQLMNTTALVGGGTTVLNSNPFAGRYRVVVSNYLADTNEWFLIADPNDIPLVEIALLNGVSTPTIETADVNFKALGIEMRGFMDWGIAAQDPRGGIASNPS